MNMVFRSPYAVVLCLSMCAQLFTTSLSVTQKTVSKTQVPKAQRVSTQTSTTSMPKTEAVLTQEPEIHMSMAPLSTAQVSKVQASMKLPKAVVPKVQVPKVQTPKALPKTAGEDTAVSFKPMHVRVLLDEYEQGAEHDWWEVRARDEKVLITDLHDVTHSFVVRAVRIVPTLKGFTVIDTKRREYVLSGAMRLQSVDHHLSVNGTWYQGTLYVITDNNHTYLINNLDVEKYVYAVLNTESFPGWPVEMHKVLAIACRSYVVAKMMDAERKGDLYHIRNTNVHQTYRGYHETETIAQAVDQTRGLILTYAQKPIEAMYDICCGGIVPAKRAGGIMAPYLARTYACTHCKSSKVFHWACSYPVADIEHALRHDIAALRTIKDIKVDKKDRAGLVNQVVIKAASGYHYVSRKRFNSLFKKIKSSCYAIAREHGSIIFKGRGYGHHLGLCQWGARQLVREGWDFKRILSFYYPKTHFMKLNHSIA